MRTPQRRHDDRTPHQVAGQAAGEIFRWPTDRSRGSLLAVPQPESLFTAEASGRKQPASRPAQPSENPMPYLRHILCVTVLALAGFGGPGGVPASVPAGSGVDAEMQLSARPEVRLRKLHLVRPDLIPYPIAYDVYC